MNRRLTRACKSARNSLVAIAFLYSLPAFIAAWLASQQEGVHFLPEAVVWLLVFAVPVSLSVYGAILANRGQRSARFIGSVVAIPLLFAVPIGTLLGGIALYQLHCNDFLSAILVNESTEPEEREPRFIE